jgi:hypothetical protein
MAEGVGGNGFANAATPGGVAAGLGQRTATQVPGVIPGGKEELAEFGCTRVAA